MDLTAAEAAMRLNGNRYGDEGSPALFAEMKAAGLVAVFGASDDLMEFRGAIDEELSAYEGTTAFLTSDGLVQNECDNDRCPYHAKREKSAATIEAKWDDGGYSWRYETAIPHVKFVIIEDDESYCEGIVFELAKVAA